MIGALLAFVIVIIAIVVLGVKTIQTEVIKIILFIILILLEIFCLGKFSLVEGTKVINNGFSALKEYSVLILAGALGVVVIIAIIMLAYKGRQDINKKIIKKKNTKDEMAKIVEKIYNAREYENDRIDSSRDLVNKLISQNIVIIRNINNKEFLSINRKQKKANIIKKEIEKNKINSDYFEDNAVDKYILEFFYKEDIISYERLENSYIDIKGEELLTILKNLIRQEKISMIIDNTSDCDNRKFKKYESILS